MWIYTSTSFLSVVAHKTDADSLLVRARVEGDIEKLFPSAKVKFTPRGDYLYRAVIDRAEVASIVAQQLLNVSYENFKNSVPKDDDKRHMAYLDCWSVMYSWGNEEMPGKRKPKKRTKQFAWLDDLT